jgi:hypothetical protein
LVDHVEVSAVDAAVDEAANDRDVPVLLRLVPAGVSGIARLGFECEVVFASGGRVQCGG